MHAEGIAQRARHSLIVRVHEGYARVVGRDMNALGALVAHYVTKRDVAELETAGCAPIEVYRTAITGTVTQRDYEAFSDYHLDNIEYDGYPAFEAYPYRLAALELLAIAHRTGVPVSGKHPLLTSPLARPREVESLVLKARRP